MPFKRSTRTGGEAPILAPSPLGRQTQKLGDEPGRYIKPAVSLKSALVVLGLPLMAANSETPAVLRGSQNGPTQHRRRGGFRGPVDGLQADLREASR